MLMAMRFPIFMIARLRPETESSYVTLSARTEQKNISVIKIRIIVYFQAKITFYNIQYDEYINNCNSKM